MGIYELSDSQLVKLFKTGNDEAFTTLLNKHKSRVYTAIYLIVKDRYVAEDLLQDSFIKAVNTIKSGRYNEEGKFLPWILRIAHNLAIDYFRKEKRHPVVVMENGDRVFNTLKFADEPIENKQIKMETQKMLRLLIQELPQAQKEVLIMRHYMQMSFREIADSTGVSINTALGRMRYALINLKKRMQQTNITYDENFYQK